MLQAFVTPRARADVSSITRWIRVTRQSPDGATTWSLAFREAVRRVQVNPEIHSVVSEHELQDLGIQQISFKTRQGKRYRVIFIIENNVVQVLRVRGPGQPPLSKDEVT